MDATDRARSYPAFEKGAAAVQADETERAGVQVVAAAQVRQLHAPDEAALAQFLQTDRGYGLFITSNMLSFGLNGSDLRFWGQFHHTSHAPPHLEGALMLAGHNANLYVAEGVDPAPLIERAARERLHFVMGEARLMARMQARLGARVRHVEEHHFAELPRHRFQQPAHAALPPSVRVRRGVPRDVDALARLYFNTNGFEDMTYPQVRNTMMSRVSHLRTYLAEAQGRVLAAASTSAESYSAAMIGGVWTAPVARGQGLSTAVVSALCADLLSERLRPHLFYLIDNAPAARVYAKLGFRLSGGWRVVYCAA
jgi:RimJ/RimL family protein N-acetyltransferase